MHIPRLAASAWLTLTVSSALQAPAGSQAADLEKSSRSSSYARGLVTGRDWDRFKAVRFTIRH